LRDFRAQAVDQAQDVSPSLYHRGR
jgi:hypothetical protein